MPLFQDAETGEIYEMGADGSPVAVDGGRFREDGGPRDSVFGPYIGESVQDYGAAAGAAFNDYYRGAQSLLGFEDRDSVQGARAAEQAALQAARERSPTATMLGDYAPETLMAVADRGRSLVGSAMLGGSEGIRLQDTLGEQALTGGASAAFAAAFPALERIMRSATGMADVMSRRTEASRRAKEAGLPVTAGDVTGQGTFLRRMDDAAEDIPGSNLLAADPKDQGQTLLNRAANNAIGETGDTVTKENLKNSADRLKGNYRQLSEAINEGGRVQLPEDTQDAIGLLYSRMKKRQGLSSFQGLAEGGDGTVSGSELLELHKLMVRQADLADNVDSGLSRDIITEVIGPLDNIIENQLGEQGADLWRTTREQWRFHHLLTQGKSVTGSNVNAASLNTRTARNMPEVVALGEGERLYTDAGRNLVELTNLVSDPTLRAGNQSGTARRLGAMGTMAIPAASAADIATTGGVGTATAAATLGANAAYQGASRRAPYLMGDMANQAGMPSSLFSNPGQTLDQMLYPFVGTEDERPIGQ